MVTILLSAITKLCILCHISWSKHDYKEKVMSTPMFWWSRITIFNLKQSFIVLLTKILVNYQRKKKTIVIIWTFVNAVMLTYCDFLLTLMISPLTLHLNSLCFVYGIIEILDHQNIWTDITFSVLSCLVQEIWHKIHNLIMAESKMVTMATNRCFCHGYISENVQGAYYRKFLILGLNLRYDMLN